MLRRRELRKEFIRRSILSGGRFISPAQSKWEAIQRAVNDGTAATLYPVGSEIEDVWGEYTAPWIVVNHYENGNMALQWKFASSSTIQFDAPEAIYYADENGLPAGTYHINIGSDYGTGWVANTHIQFTLTRAMEDGDQLYINCGASSAINPSNSRLWLVYHAGDTIELERGITSGGEGGTLLGVIGNLNYYTPNEQLNSISRVIFGDNRWSQSGVRQYLNSAATKGNWWILKNPWDRPPNMYNTIDGFLSSFTEEFLAVLKEVDVITAINSQEESAILHETTQDKIFLPSLQEVYITPQFADIEGEDWDYYKMLAIEAGLSGKFSAYKNYEILKKYNITSQTSSVIWLRSCARGSYSGVWCIRNTGQANPYATANDHFNACPACIIQKSI